MTHHIDHHRSGTLVRHEPTSRRERDGSYRFTDGAVRDMRALAREAHKDGWRTRKAPAVDLARAMRPHVGLA